MSEDHKDCDCKNKNCSCHCDETEVKCDNDLITEDTWFYINVKENCKDKFERFSVECFAQYAMQFVDLSNYLTQQQLTDALNNSNFVTAGQMENFVNAAIAGIQIPDVSGFTTMEAVCAKLENYFTKDQDNALNENLQNQITTLGEQLAALQMQLDACDCDGSGGGSTTTAPTVSENFETLNEPICPQIQTTTVTNPDGVMFCVELTGNGQVSVDVNSNPVGDLTNFAIPDNGVLEITLTGADGENVVGGVALSWLDTDGNKQTLDGFSYDVTCPEDNGGGNGNETGTLTLAIDAFSDTDDELDPTSILYFGILCGETPTGDFINHGSCPVTNTLCDGIYLTRFMVDTITGAETLYIGLSSAPTSDINLTFPSGDSITIPAGWPHSAGGSGGGISVAGTTIYNDILNSSILNVNWECI